ncbi:Ras family protein [Aphelenchoides bicaudatus]|nr:Ras family protein [Aphelenchoides bicaudatus]
MAITKIERRICRSEQRLKRISAGKCPHCKLLFSNPVTLSCGHSLCALCCQELLERRSNLDSTLTDKTFTENMPTTPLRTPMMGLRMLQECNVETPTTPTGRTPARPPKRFSFMIRTPECPVCGSAASNVAPIRNLALAQLIRQISRRKRDSKLATYKNPLYSLPEKHETSPRPSSSSGFESETESSSENVIQKCNVFVLGGHKVGKTQLTRTQYLNNLFFGQISQNDGTKMEKANNGELEELFAKYLLHIIDQPVQVQEVRNETPMVIVGTKSDLKDGRKVNAYEGQQLARSLNAPFFEVSSKENDCVNEVFNQLMQIIDTKPPSDF